MFDFGFINICELSPSRTLSAFYLTSSTFIKLMNGRGVIRESPKSVFSAFLEPLALLIISMYVYALCKEGSCHEKIQGQARKIKREEYEGV